MELKKLGKTKLRIPPIAFGGNVFGWTADRKTSFRLLDELLEKGFNYIDTANVYTRWVEGHSGGESETTIGKWMKERGNRDKMIIATKVGMDVGQGHVDLSADHILEQIDLRICIEITCPFLLVLLLAHCVENTRHSYGYACVFRLVVKQNNCL